MLSIREAAELLGMSERFVRREVKARRILSYKFGRSVRIDPAELSRYKLAALDPSRLPAPSNDNVPQRQAHAGHRRAVILLEKLLS